MIFINNSVFKEMTNNMEAAYVHIFSLLIGVVNKKMAILAWLMRMQITIDKKHTLQQIFGR